MKKRPILIAAAVLVLIAALALFLAAQPSARNTAAFFSRHEALLEDFVALCHEEADRTDVARPLNAIYTDFYDGTLRARRGLEPWTEGERTVSPELRAGWEAIQRHRYFTSVSCSFDESGALEIHFSAEEEWVPYGEPTEGHYRISYCLLWRDETYTGRPLEDWWHPLDGTAGQGGWYYASHKHYDG